LPSASGRQTIIAVNMGASQIFVSHYAGDFPECIRQTLRLKKGDMV
jgi:ABC-type molybdenum transport system ATPase subunit/photorepair protein PhrA